MYYQFYFRIKDRHHTALFTTLYTLLQYLLFFLFLQTTCLDYSLVIK
jgi:hypothetical protein